MDLGKMLAEALEQEGFTPPSGSGVAEGSLQAAAEAFLSKVRDAEKAKSEKAAEIIGAIGAPYTMDT